MSTKVNCKAKDPSTCRYHGKPIVSQPNQSKPDRKLKMFVSEETYHIGDLNPLSKKKVSFEGNGLSISEDPDAWQQIARLDGKIWKINTKVKLLDFHSLTSEQKQEIYDFGLKMGWVKQQTVYSVIRFDDEWNQEIDMRFTDLDEAEIEAENYEVDVIELNDWVATSSFPDATVKEGDNGSELLDKLSVAWVSRTQPQLDGVWWNDIYDISRLSAPRGVLCLNKVKSFLKHFTIE